MPLHRANPLRNSRVFGLLVFLAACTPAKAPAPIDPTESILVDSKGAWGKSALVAMEPKLKEAFDKWRKLDPKNDFAGVITVIVAPDGSFVRAQAVHTENENDPAYGIVLDSIFGFRFPSTAHDRNVALLVDVHFLADHTPPPVAPVAVQPILSLGEIDEASRKAHELHLSKCDAGDVFECVNVGYDFQKGLGVRQDYTQSAVYYERACDAKVREGAEGCADLGWLYEMGNGVKSDKPKAAKLYKEGCDLGAKLGCNNLGVMYRDGTGVAKDEPKAFAMFDKACKMEDWQGCANVGWMYSKGLGVPMDAPKAIHFYEIACNHNDPYGCHNLGYRYQMGEGVVKNTTTAASLYKKGCAAGQMDSCVNLGSLYEAGDGVTTDLEEAKKLYLQACDGSQPHGCQYLGIVYRDAGDAPSAITYFKKGCTLGDSASCSNLSALGTHP